MKPAAQIRGVSKRYGRHLAVDDITWSANSGEILGLVGPNGAGKTTLLRIIAGLVRPSSGQVLSPRAATQYFGGEHTLPPDISARAWLRLLGAASAETTTTRRLGVLSRGTRQRIGLEGALAQSGASLVLLDEPWEGLDPDASRWLSDELVSKREEGTAVVVSSHRIHDLASICDRCIFLVRGRLASESVETDRALDSGERAARLYQAFDEARR